MSTETKKTKAVTTYRDAVLSTKTTFANQFGEQAEKIFKRESGFAILAIQGNKALESCNIDSIKKAVAMVALTGISLNPTTALAYLVPRKGQATLVISYMGMIEILRNSGSVKSLRAGVVYEGDEFDYNFGTDGYLKHKPVLNRTAGTKKIGAYAIATLPDGSEEFHFMDWVEIMKRKAKSDGAKSEYSPWTNWEDEMSIKTVIRNFYKFLPKTERATEAMTAFDDANPYQENSKEVHEAEIVENELI